MSDQKTENQTIIDADFGARGIREFNGFPYVVLPEGYRFHPIESLMKTPARAQGNTDLRDIDSFVAFVNAHKTEVSTIYGLSDPAKFIAVFNDATLGKPNWADHRAGYACPLSKEWGIWIGSDGKKMSQLDFAYFIEKNLPDIYGENGNPTGATMLALATLFKANTSSVFSSGKTLQNGQVQLTYNETIKGEANGPAGTIEIPEEFAIAIPVFEAGSPYELKCKFRYSLNRDELKMWFEIIRPHKTYEAAFNDVWEAVKEKTGLPLFRGTPAE